MGAARVVTSARAKLLLILGGVAASFVLVEFVLFPLLLPWTPLKHQIYLGSGVRPLAQSSKAGTIPRDYVLLVGDSYAQGRGDWLLESDPDRNPPFHSAHVIQEQSGRDVVSFARGGTGAIRALAVEPRARFDHLEASWRFGLAAPAFVIAYHYEGNDLVDTLIELNYLFGGADGEGLDERFLDPAYFRDGVERELLRNHPLELQTTGFSLGRAFPALEFVTNLFLAEVAGRERDVPGAAEEDLFPSGAFEVPVLGNALRIRGTTVPVSAGLQGPSLGLDGERTQQALYALEQSLAMLRETFPAAVLCLVYVPSPAACYEHAVDPIRVQTWSGVVDFAPSVVYERSASLRAAVEEIASRHADRFVDATPALRQAGTRTLLHGPRDVRHLNRAGYSILGRMAARCLGPDAADEREGRTPAGGRDALSLD